MKIVFDLGLPSFVKMVCERQRRCGLNIHVFYVFVSKLMQALVVFNGELP